MLSRPKEVPWPVWAVVAIAVALISAYALIQSRTPVTPPIIAPPTVADISGRYFPEGERQLVILVSRLQGDEYRIEQLTGSWPWEGTATLDGGGLYGEGASTTSQAKFRIEGAVRNDGSIEVDYKFITKSDGSPGAGTVHEHVWISEKSLSE